MGRKCLNTLVCSLCHFGHLTNFLAECKVVGNSKHAVWIIVFCKQSYSKITLWVFTYTWLEFESRITLLLRVWQTAHHLHIWKKLWHTGARIHAAQKKWSVKQSPLYHPVQNGFPLVCFIFFRLMLSSFLWEMQWQNLEGCASFFFFFPF